MAHVFKLHTRGTDTLNGWDVSKKIGEAEIETILDPSGAKADLPITSVPTPFASLELVRSAYAYCSNPKNSVQGTTIYHRLVSFSLDILEMFFNFRKYERDFDIITWDATRSLDTLLNSPNEAHRRLGRTLQLYLKQDARSFNFDARTTFHILNYKHGPAPVNIIGGTSPTSLCVASVNEGLDNMLNVMLSGNHRALSANPNEFRALSERDHAFFRYLFALTKQPGFGECYPEVRQYVEECFKTLSDRKFKDDLLTVNRDSLADYETLQVGQATLTFAGGIPLGMFSAPSPDAVSDFTVKTERHGEPLPLVLPCSIGFRDEEMRYVSGPWDGSCVAPFYDAAPMSERRLPFDGTQHPYLTANDVFQSYLIRTAFPISTQDFFTGAHTADRHSYLLPVRKELLRYLPPSALRGNTGGAHPQPLIELSDLPGGSVKAVVRIPVRKGRFITFERTYLGGGDFEPDIENNKGAIVNCTFDLFIYPSYHIVRANAINVPTPGRIYIVDEDVRELTRHFDYKVEAWTDYGDAPLRTDHGVRADKNTNAGFTTKYYALDDQYDYLAVSNGTAEGIVVPLFRQKNMGTKTYEFAIDFGTTNTHIEYKVDGQVRPLEFTAGQSLVLSLHDSHRDDIEKRFLEEDHQTFYEATAQEFLPLAITGGGLYHFPLRTNLCEVLQRGAATTRKPVTLGDANVGFHYEKTHTYTEVNTVHTNLKWTGTAESDLVENYFEELLMLIRTKVLLGAGNLSATRITWFYPVSMEPFRLSQLRAAWNSLTRRLIGPQCAPVAVAESLAPFYHYKNAEGVSSAHRPVVSMDIGGGTTDFVVYQDNRPVLISSVRFAGNCVFGDFPGLSMKMNGYFNRYNQRMRELLDDSGVMELIDAYGQIVERGRADDFVSFLFSLEGNAALKAAGRSISFSDELKRDYDMKLVVLLFLAAEIYYIAHVLRLRGIGTPSYLTLSGTGSKILNLVGEPAEVELFIRRIFNDVLSDTGKMELKTVENPKEITCKGGLCLNEDDVAVDADELKYCYTAADEAGAGTGLRLSEIDGARKQHVLSFYKGFIDYFFSLDTHLSFARYFGISTQKDFATYREVLLEKAEQDLATMLESRRREQNEPNAVVEDSLFFFPLAGGIHRLAHHISNK